MAVLPNAVYRFVQSNQIPVVFRTDADKAILKFIWKRERPQLAKAILHKRVLGEVSACLISSYTTEP